MTRKPQPRVLVIDDCEAVRTLLAFWLTGLGCDVQTAESGHAAQEAAEQHVPDLILLDVVLPGLNGFEICRQLKQHAVTRSIPVVMISGLQHPENARRAREVGATHYLMKPLDESELMAVIRSVVGALARPADAPGAPGARSQDLSPDPSRPTAEP